MTIKRVNYSAVPQKRHERAIEFRCDGCGVGLETGTNIWDDALDMMREEGWRAVEESDGWQHYCENCTP